LEFSSFPLLLFPFISFEQQEDYHNQDVQQTKKLMSHFLAPGRNIFAASFITRLYLEDFSNSNGPNRFFASSNGPGQAIARASTTQSGVNSFRSAYCFSSLIRLNASDLHCVNEMFQTLA